MIGKVACSDEPCVGAAVVDTTPTQGLDKITRSCKKGGDVQKIEFDTVMAEALNPLLHETPDPKKPTAQALEAALKMPSWNAHLALKDYQREKTQKIAL